MNKVVFSGVVLGHVACKYTYVRIFRGTSYMHEKSLVSIGAWVVIAFITWTVAWVIMESIPVFNDLLSLIVSTCVTNNPTPHSALIRVTECPFRKLV